RHAMAQPNQITIPWSQRLRWLRIQAVPLLIFAFCAFGALRLWKGQGGTARAVGEVYALRVDLISRLDGLLTDVPYRRLQLFDRVQAGDVVLRLDDQAIRATLGTLGKSLEVAEAGIGTAGGPMRMER